jgi:molybdopterin-containing oxidoreductase family membrane subunit
MTAALVYIAGDSEALDEAPIIRDSASDAALTDQLLRPILEPPRWLVPAMAVTALGSLVLFVAVGYTVTTGIGVWGNNIPVAWAFAITNFVWWIGIGHAGTFISAFLLLLEQRWRTSINRVAEAMTLFAVVQAGLFPLLHMGRPWFFYWLVPYPATMRVWPQFRSSLPWDVAAVTTYFTVSLLFWYLGLVPDLAIVRDRAPGELRRRIYGVLALGWRGSARAWGRYRIAYGLLAGLATPLVVSVHSIVSTDFAIASLPGWHSTIFPPYFVAGALYSGFAMVVALVLPVRRLYRLENVITEAHLDVLGKMLLLTGWIVTYSYGCEIFIAWLSGNRYEMWTHLHARPFGPIAVTFWIVIFGNVVAPQALWSRWVRVNPIPLFVVTCFAQLGMWMERFMLIVSSEEQDFLPSSWNVYHPSIIDFSILFGTISFFLFLFLLFLRFFPFIPISDLLLMRFEMRQEEREERAASRPATDGPRAGEGGDDAGDLR